MKYPPHLNKLIGELKKLPGVGHKTAERFAFHLLTRSARELENIAETIRLTPQFILKCEECGCLSELTRCHFCENIYRNASLLCIVGSPKDAFAIEQTHEFKGIYHVLGALLSPLEGKGPELLLLDQLKKRIQERKVKEVIIALDSTLEGDATTLYIKQELAHMEIAVTRLAFGIPMGSALDYLDGGTLGKALSGRRGF